MELRFMMHKAGGRITKIETAEHKTIDGVADWFYRGTVEWNNGGKSVGTEIPPWAVCYDPGNTCAKAEYTIISKRLTDHLNANGRWLDKMKEMRDGRMVGWISKKKSAVSQF